MPEMMEPSTEYTLQGVMRFLQIEWHNHERARNAWDIERAEMKARIAKHEGESRSSKKVNEMLERQVQMLEKVLKHERAKNKALTNGEEPPQLPSEEEVMGAWNGKIGVKPSDSFPGVELPKDTEQQSETERDSQRDKSKAFLQKCLEELTYLLTPPAHPLPPQPNHQSQGSSFEPKDVPMHDAYVQQQQHAPRRRNPQISHLPSLPNHPPPPRSNPEFYQSSQHGPQPDSIPQHLPSQPPETVSRMPDEVQGQQPMSSRQMDEPVEQITHSFDSYGRQISSNDPHDSRSMMNVDANGWDFDDSNTLLDPNPSETSPRHLRLEQTDQFPNVSSLPAKSPPRTGHGSHRRKSSGSVGHLARKHSSGSSHDLGKSHEPLNFNVKFALRGHIDVVRSVIFTGGGSPSEPEVCTTGDDGTIKRWIIPAYYSTNSNKHALPPYSSQPSDTDIQSYFTHRGHEGTVTSLAACPSANSPASPSFSTGGRALGDGWIFSGGQDTTIRVWERGRVDPKATLEGHTDAVWALAVLPAPASSILGGAEPTTGNPSLSATTHPVLPPSRDDGILLVSGAADGTIKIWTCSAPPTMHSPQPTATGARRGSRRLSVTSGSNFPSSPQPSTASGTLFHYQLVHNIDGLASSPTSIATLGAGGESFVVAFADAQCVVFDTRTGESVVGMQSQETYDGTPGTGVNAVVVAGQGFGGNVGEVGEGGESKEGEEVHGATGSQKDGGVEGVVITGHEDRFVRFFDANSGQCTYSMLAHPASIASLSLSPDGRELLTAGHDASVRVWSLEKRSCTQEITCHRPMRGEGVVSATWSFDGRWVVTAGGDGVVKVLGRG